MWHIVTDGVAWWSVCLSVCHVREPCKNVWTDWHVVWEWTLVSPRKHVLDGGAYWRHLANMIEPSMCGCDAPYVKVLWPFVFIGRPFLKRFTLRYLSVLSAMLVYCGQVVWITMKLGIQVGLGAGHIVLDEDPALPLPKGHSPQFSAHVC